MFFSRISCLVVLLAFSVPTFSFTYNLQLIEYKGGVISQLNNCGAVYTDNGKYLMGQRNLSAKLTTGDKYLSSMYSAADGVVSILSGSDIYFSPDGRYLDGGGATKFIHSINPEYQSGNNRYGLPIYTRYVNTLLISFKNEFIVAQNKEFIPRNCRWTVCTGDGHHRTDFTIISVISGAKKKFESASKSRRLNNLLGVVADRVYVQFTNGDIGYFNSVDSMSSMDSVNIVHYGAPQINQIIPYAGGLLAYTKNVVYASRSLDQVISGSEVTQLYSSSRNISDLLNYQGDAVDGTDATKGIIAAFEDGYVYFSLDGNNLAGGGSTRELSRPFDTERMKQQTVNYLLGLANPQQGVPLLIREDPFNFKSPYSGVKINVSAISVRLLNKGESTEYAENAFFTGTAYSRVYSLASDFGGEPTTVKVYDKGWDGIEYKWRDRGDRTGVVDHKVEASYAGIPEVRIRAQSSCAVLVAYEEIGGTPEPLSFNWNINADFSIANNGAGLSSLSSMFAPGGTDYRDILPVDYIYRPNKFTLHEIINLAIYNSKVYVRNKYGHDLIRGPLPIYIMRTDADRAKFPH
jgi:hypothetical protein